MTAVQRTGGSSLAGDLWGGLAAMLVALPSAIAFGVLIYTAIGPDYAGEGALAGILGAAALGIVAPLASRNGGFITAPCAPAAAVMSALAAQLVASGQPPVARIVMLLALTALLSSLLQMLYGLVRAGRLIKFIPYQVVSGYLSGVAVIIAVGQLPKLLGLHKSVSLGPRIARAIAVGLDRYRGRDCDDGGHGGRTADHAESAGRDPRLAGGDSRLLRARVFRPQAAPVRRQYAGHRADRDLRFNRRRHQGERLVTAAGGAGRHRHDIHLRADPVGAAVDRHVEDRCRARRADAPPQRFESGIDRAGRGQCHRVFCRRHARRRHDGRNPGQFHQRRAHVVVGGGGRRRSWCSRSCCWAA